MRARRILAAMASALAIASAQGAAAPASAEASTAHVCVFRAAVHDTPRGLVIGYLHDEARVRLLGRTGNKRWYRIKGPLSLVGWMKARHLCR